MSCWKDGTPQKEKVTQRDITYVSLLLLTCLRTRAAALFNLQVWVGTVVLKYCSISSLQVFQTFLVSFNEQRRPIMPLLTAMRRAPKLSPEQRALREAWDAINQKVLLQTNDSFCML